MLEQHRVSSIVRQQRLNAECAENVFIGFLFVGILIFLAASCLK